MAKIIVEEPERYDLFNIDSNGKIHVGKEFSGMQARIVIESIEEAADEE